MSQELYDVIVVGGGASGMIAAVEAASYHDKVLLVEKADKLGRKVAASGNGRCNLMNRSSLRYYGDSWFAREVFAHCPPAELESTWYKYGLILAENADARVYPVTYHSSTVLDTLKIFLDRYGVRILYGTEVKAVHPGPNGFTVDHTANYPLCGKRIILATGGPAQPKLGGNRDGVRMLEELGYTSYPYVPALCPVCTDTRSVSGLAGIRCNARVRLLSGKQSLHEERGEVLFTEYGISGICVMQCARFIPAVPGCSIELDMAESLLPDGHSLNDELFRRRDIFRMERSEKLLTGMLVPKLAFAVMKQAGMPLRGETVQSLTDEDVRRIGYTMTHYRLQVTGTRGFDYAQAAAGGIACRHFNPATMESVITSGLHATGELLNIDGDCGGYNLMFAFATGILAGRNGRCA